MATTAKWIHTAKQYHITRKVEHITNATASVTISVTRMETVPWGLFHIKL